MAVLLTQRADRPKTYTKTEVDDIMQAKQNTLSVIYPMNLGSRVASCPLLVGSNIIPGLSVQLPLTLTRNENNYLMIGRPTSIFNQPTLSVNTQTPSGDIAAGSITTSSGHISSTSGNIQTRDGTVGGKNGPFQNLPWVG